MSELTFETALQNVISKLNAPKNQRNSFGNYNYRSAEDIIEAVKPLLTENKLRMKISDDIVVKGDRYYVKATVTVSGYEKSDSASAFAREPVVKKGMDEAQITGATSSYARKYALNGMFDIDDTKDADTNEHHQETKAKKPAGNPWRASDDKPVSDNQRVAIANLLRGTIGIESKEEISQWLWDNWQGEPKTEAQAQAIIESLSVDRREVMNEQYKTTPA